MKQKLIDFMAVFIGTRKFLAWFCLFIIAVLFRLNEYINGEQFVDLAKATFLGFVAGNSVEHFTNTAKSYMDSKGKTVTTPTDDNVEISG